MGKAILHVEGMSCGHCVKAVTDALTALEGIENVSVDLESKKVSIEYRAEKIILEKIKYEIEEQGYDVVD